MSNLRERLDTEALLKVTALLESFYEAVQENLPLPKQTLLDEEVILESLYRALGPKVKRVTHTQ